MLGCLRLPIFVASRSNLSLKYFHAATSAVLVLRFPVVLFTFSTSWGLWTASGFVIRRLLVFLSTRAKLINMEKDTSPWSEKTCDTASSHPLQEVPGNAEAVQVSLRRAMPPCVAGRHPTDVPGPHGSYHCPTKRTLVYKLRVSGSALPCHWHFMQLISPHKEEINFPLHYVVLFVGKQTGQYELAPCRGNARKENRKTSRSFLHRPGRNHHLPKLAVNNFKEVSFFIRMAVLPARLHLAG